jgi:YD repeat-containing protein
MTIITKKFLNFHNAHKEYIKFFENNFPKELFPNGLDLERIKVTGDYNSYFDYIYNLPKIKFDDKGNIIKKIFPNGNIHRYEHDLKGNIIKEIFPDGYVYQYEYDSLGNMVKRIFPNDKVYQYEYNNNGNMIKKIFPNDKVYQYEYNNNGNMIKKIFPNGNFHKIIFKYDSMGRLIQINNCHIEYI